MIRTTRSTAARLLTAAAAAFILGGCATKGDLRNLQTEIRSLAARQDSLMAQLRMETRSTQDTLRTQTDQLFDFRGQVFQALSQIRQSLDRIEALAGENQRGIAGVRDQMANLRRTPVMPPSVTPEEGGEGIAGQVPPEELYRTAMEQYNRGSTSTARTAFQQFLEAYPNHSLAPEVHYRLADILVQENRPEDAMEAFREIQELFPTSDKVPEALYRIALLQIMEGDEDDARDTLERIVNTYPGTTMAMVAQDKLDEIR